MERQNMKRRMMLSGFGGVVLASMGGASLQAQSRSPISQELRAVLDKIARTDEGFAEPRIPVESLPASSTAVHLISKSGSYYLNADLSVPAGKNGIEIAADDVDIDGCGFHVNGVAGAVTSRTGIFAKGSNITLSDLSVSRCDSGCDFTGASRFVIWDVAALHCTRFGFALGDFGQSYDVEAYECGIALVTVGKGCCIEECGAFHCSSGFEGRGAGNLFLANSATDCAKPFTFEQTNAWGPVAIVAGAGDISLSPAASHPGANFVY
jgi:hypothetical protein